MMELGICILIKTVTYSSEQLIIKLVGLLLHNGFHTFNLLRNHTIIIIINL